ncbi:MAG: type IV toxin-antitoxin system AbiEi family antitoxin domain-containing protein [Alphaproteobacteria bacterium]|nr:type IV toxin-antitoxin system AbiEi family antitoxin domain-containing protein [Alphaproteobacteria bacterium]
MTHAKRLVLDELLSADGGIIKTTTLNSKGFTSRDIKRLVLDGLLFRIKQGHYTGKEQDVSDIEIAAKLIPTGVLCLFTAIEHYELATVNPTEICIALPRGVKCPTLPATLYVNVFHMTDSHFRAGIAEVEINGSKIKIYDIEKTVCDCFKYDNNVEKGIALEVIKNYIAREHCNIQKLLEYANLLGKKKIIYPYVEALI